jgi:type II secretory pathway pseudopilin PulG
VKRDRIQLAGLTLVEVALLLALAGILLAVGLPAFVRGLRTSKTAEAGIELERIFAGVAAYYAASRSTPSGTFAGCLPEPAGPTPERPSQEPAAVEFGAPTGPGAATWRAIGYEPSTPIRYRYSLQPLRPGCSRAAGEGRDQTLLRLRAEADLDGDGALSTFERTAHERDGQLVIDDTLIMHDRTE